MFKVSNQSLFEAQAQLSNLSKRKMEGDDKHNMCETPCCELRLCKLFCVVMNSCPL